MKVRVNRMTPFPRGAVYSWWTDFREDDHEHSGSPATSIRTVLRRIGNDIWLQDRATRPIRVTIKEHVILDPPSGYAVEARYPAAESGRPVLLGPMLSPGTRVRAPPSIRGT